MKLPSNQVLPKVGPVAFLRPAHSGRRTQTSTPEANLCVVVLVGSKLSLPTIRDGMRRRRGAKESLFEHPRDIAVRG